MTGPRPRMGRLTGFRGNRRVNRLALFRSRSRGFPRVTGFHRVGSVADGNNSDACGPTGGSQRSLFKLLYATFNCNVSPPAPTCPSFMDRRLARPYIGVNL